MTWPSGHPRARLRDLAVEAHVAVQDPLLEAAPRIVRQQLGQHLVQAAARAVGGDRQALLRKLHGLLGYTAASRRRQRLKNASDTAPQPFLAPPHDRPAGILLGRPAGRLLEQGKEERDLKSGAADLYERGNKSMQSGNFSNAIRYFEDLEARFPVQQRDQAGAARPHLLLLQGPADRGHGGCRHDLRAGEPDPPAGRLRPVHARPGLLRGRAQSWYHRWFNVDLSKRPPKNVQESFSVFAQLVQRFPNSVYAVDARQRMVFLRNRLADYELHVARYYLKRGAWLAAANRASSSSSSTTGRPRCSEALGIMVQCLRQARHDGLADERGTCSPPATRRPPAAGPGRKAALVQVLVGKVPDT